MTVHIALANGTEAVLFSDSQGSTNVAESHGFHKQFVGNNYAVGAAGHGGIIMRLFAYLNSELGVESDFSASEVSGKIESFLSEEVRQKYWEAISILLVTADGGTAIRQFDPGVFSKAGPATGFATIGSGAEFVSRALNRHNELGIALPAHSLADLIVAATHYAEAANESLTVDDLLSVAFVANGRSYLLGEAEVNVWLARRAVIQSWRTIASRWEKVSAIVRTINAEIREAQRSFSNIRTGSIDSVLIAKITASNQAVLAQRAQLLQALNEFMTYYDGLIAR